jgi:hypothetical protein
MQPEMSKPTEPCGTMTVLISPVLASMRMVAARGAAAASDRASPHRLCFNIRVNSFRPFCGLAAWQEVGSQRRRIIKMLPRRHTKWITNTILGIS